MTRLAVHSAHYLHRHGERVLLATVHPEDVTCLRCKYWLRLYIPIGRRLKRHQVWQRHFYLIDLINNDIGEQS